MPIHPKIKRLIDLLKWAGIQEHEIKKRYALDILKDNGATLTEAMVVLHQGFNLAAADAEMAVKQSQIWEPEAIQDIAYETFLYLNYNPDDPNFKYDENTVRFSILPQEKKSDDDK